ncbi:MAG: hypothetical protein H7224_05010 [Polaromonas sp.]|nr:hypothetical protein [Polaromonas sp.]
MNTFRRLPLAITALQAAENAPALAQLARLLKESSDRLKAIQTLLPVTLRPAIQPGPIDDKSWCILVHSAAASAKTRQLIPAMERRLSDEGWKPLQIRLKILVAKK